MSKHLFLPLPGALIKISRKQVSFLDSRITVRETAPAYRKPPSRFSGCGTYALLIFAAIALAVFLCAGILLYFPNPDTPPTPTVRFIPTETLTETPTRTRTPSETPSDTPTMTATPTASNTATHTSTPTQTYTPSDSPTATFTASDTPSNTPTWTFTPSNTPTHTPTPTDTPTDTPTPTYTPTNTPTSTQTYTPSYTATATATSTNTATYTATFTFTPTPTPLTRTIALTINFLSTDNIQEDIIVGDNVDEIRLIYEIQEVDPAGNIVSENQVENTYRNNNVQAGANMTSFDSLTITIPSSHSVRIRIRLAEDDRTVIGGFVVDESTNTFTPIIEVVFSADEILNAGGVITRTGLMTDEDFLRSAQYDIEYSVFVIQ